MSHQKVLLGSSQQSSAPLHHHAAINAKDLASNVICLRGSKKRNRARNIFRLPRFSERNPRLNRFLNVVGQSRSHVSCDKSRRNRIHRNVSARQFARKRFCETNQASLARSVIRLTCVADQTDHRANVNNAAAALLNHRALHGLDEIECTFQIRVDDRVPVFHRHAHAKSVAPHTGVVD